MTADDPHGNFHAGDNIGWWPMDHETPDYTVINPCSGYVFPKAGGAPPTVAMSGEFNTDTGIGTVNVGGTLATYTRAEYNVGGTNFNCILGGWELNDPDTHVGFPSELLIVDASDGIGGPAATRTWEIPTDCELTNINGTGPASSGTLYLNTTTSPPVINPNSGALVSAAWSGSVPDWGGVTSGVFIMSYFCGSTSVGYYCADLGTGVPYQACGSTYVDDSTDREFYPWSIFGAMYRPPTAGQIWNVRGFFAPGGSAPPPFQCNPLPVTIT